MQGWGNGGRRDQGKLLGGDHLEGREGAGAGQSWKACIPADPGPPAKNSPVYDAGPLDHEGERNVTQPRQ